MSSPTSTLPLPEQIWGLHLAGADPVTIASGLKVPLDQVLQVVEEHAGQDDPDLETELARLNVIWRGIYGKAVSGDVECAKLAVAISKHRTAIAGPPKRAVEQPDPAVPLNPAHRVRDAWTILAINAPTVATRMVDIANNSTNHSAAVAAGFGILDRVGIIKTERSEVAVHIMNQYVDADPEEGAIDPGEIVRQRLHAIRARKTPVIVDADVDPA